MKLVKSFFIAFSLYSKIPVPQFEWKEEDMKYTLCFFPWVGAVIGGCVCLWRVFCEAYEVGLVCDTFFCAAIPLLITGGFHVDGFMDTMDAFHSYQPKEKKLEILKDSHIGAFAVIMFALYGLFYLGAFSEIRDKALFGIVCEGFFLSRCLSGIAAVSFPSAKKEGLLYLFSNASQKTIVRAALGIQGAACVVCMMLLSFVAGAVVAAAAMLSFGYYYYRCRKELDGITGDTAGYFVLLCEGSIVIAAALLNVLG